MLNLCVFFDMVSTGIWMHVTSRDQGVWNAHQIRRGVSYSLHRCSKRVRQCSLFINSLQFDEQQLLFNEVFDEMKLTVNNIKCKVGIVIYNALTPSPLPCESHCKWNQGGSRFLWKGAHNLRQFANKQKTFQLFALLWPILSVDNCSLWSFLHTSDYNCDATVICDAIKQN